jgi:coenzyme PQQ precursor peptide PqqA
MNVETSEENGVGRIRLEGALDGKTAPEVREQNVGLEVTSYLPADIDLV